MQGQTLFSHSKIHSICILRLSAIGDVCHAVSMVQQLTLQLPSAQITWVVGKIEMQLLEGLPDIEFVVFDKSMGLEGYRALRQKFKSRKFDVLLHMQVALRASLASLCIQAKFKVGFDRKRAKEGQWLFTNRTIEPQKTPHVLEGFHAFARVLGVNIKGDPQWEMPIDEEHELFASKLLETGDGKSHFAVISPAASKIERNWHSLGYAAAAEYLFKKGFTVVLCGGPAKSERDLANEIIRNVNIHIIDLVGKTSLKQLLGVLTKVDLVIAPDTGPAHMAVTVGTPVIGLYAHSNPLRTGPYLYQKYVASVYDKAINDQYGKSWEQLPWGTRAKGENLMEGITIESVCEKIDRVVNDFYPELAQ